MTTGFHLFRRALCRVAVGFLLFVSFFLNTTASEAQIWFTQDMTQFTNPDVQDIFLSRTRIRFLPGSGTNIALDNPALFNLREGDNIDAFHHELRPINADHTVYFPGFVFTVEENSRGRAGTSVRQQSRTNGADFFESNGLFYNVLVASSRGVGLVDEADVDGFMLTPSISLQRDKFFYISLTPGSPTLAALGASPADIIACSLNAPPKISIRARQLGLRVGDDMDGLVMVGGADLNCDGDFDDRNENLPAVIFSVDHFSRGLPGSSVSFEQLTDFPSGGDIFTSLGLGANNLFQDSRFIGLSPHDELNGLDLPSLSVPAGTPGGGLTPGGDPYSGGASTPGAPGTPGGPPIPPSPPGLPMCTKVGLCINACSEDCCDIEVVITMCVGPRKKIKIKVKCDDCDDSNGSELEAAVLQIANALRGCRDRAGNPIFAGVGGVVRGPRHAFVNFRVNPAVCITGVRVNTAGCHCYTQNVKGSVKADKVKDPVCKVDTVKDNPGGIYMFHVAQDEKPYFFEVSRGSREHVLEQIYHGFADEGFDVSFSEEEGICIWELPNGEPCLEVFGAGFVEGGNGNVSLGFSWTAPDN